MTLELKNSSEFRSYPFRNYAPGTKAIRKATALFQRAVADCQIDVFVDRESTDVEPLPLVAFDNILLRKGSQTGPSYNEFTIEFALVFGYGGRDEKDNPIADGETRTRRVFGRTAKVSFVGSYNPTGKSDKYEYLWISDTLGGFNAEAPGLGEEGTKAYVTGYVALDMEFLATSLVGVESGNYYLNRAFEPDTLFLEDANVTYSANQVVRQAFIVNKDKIPAPGFEKPEGRLYRLQKGATDQPFTFNGDVKFEPGFNCEIEVNSDTDTVTFVPSQGAGFGEPCGDSDPDSGEEGCADFVFSINGVRSDDGSVTFQSVAPLQIFQGDPDFEAGVDYDKGAGNLWPFSDDFESEFWTHSLVFRVGTWGDNNDTPCVEPDCP